MPFSVICNHKDCRQLQTPYLDKESNLVYCSNCDNEITNITPFIKNQMRMNKQFRTVNKAKRKAFELKCSLCQKESRPILINDQVCCGACSKPLTQLTPFYIQMLKTQISKSADITEDPTLVDGNINPAKEPNE